MRRRTDADKNWHSEWKPTPCSSGFACAPPDVRTRAPAPEVTLAQSPSHDVASESIAAPVAHREGTGNAGVPAARSRDLTDP